MDLWFISFKNMFYLLLFLVGSSICFDGDFGQIISCCTHEDYVDTKYEIIYTFNKKLILEYNSTTAKWTGFTEKGIHWAQGKNNDPYDPPKRQSDKSLLCGELIMAMKERYYGASAPSLELKSVKQSSGSHPAVFKCSAYNFYPKEIELTWLLDGQEIRSAVTSSEILSDGDLLYQIHSYLEFSAKPGEDISCMVEHETLQEPLVQHWDSSHLCSEQDKIAVGTLLLVLGLIFMVSGFVYYKKKSDGHCTPFPGHRIIPVEVVNEDGMTKD